jgi:hypothetical protein
MPTGICSIVRIGGLKKSTGRAVVFLVCNGELNGKSVFDGLPAARDREVRSRFEYWIDGHDSPKTYFHGWDDSEYHHCFCFKWKNNTVDQRLYGFKYRSKNNPRFQLCVLVLHAAKSAKNTDLTILNEINRLRLDKKVIAAIEAYLEGK